jgi:hypothetical protein
VASYDVVNINYGLDNRRWEVPVEYFNELSPHSPGENDTKVIALPGLRGDV